MRLDKINILAGEWSDQKSWSQTGKPSLADRFALSQFTIIQERSLPITRLYDESYWGELRSIHQISLAKLDARHWYFDDETFQRYIRQVSSIRFPSISFGECPYESGVPRGIRISSFEKKIFERTKIFANVIKNKHPNTLVVSPPIVVLGEDFRQPYLNYFLHNRKYFDIYALNGCVDGKEQSVALLTAFLNEVLSILKKEVWITRWAISCINEIVQNKLVLGEPYRPMFVDQAAVWMKSFFDTIESITKDQSKWFYSGCMKDEYHPTKKAPIGFWHDNPHLSLSDDDLWDFSHFLGLIDYHNKVKEPILHSLIQLHDRAK